MRYRKNTKIYQNLDNILRATGTTIYWILDHESWAHSSRPWTLRLPALQDVLMEYGSISNQAL